jgi:hypothetical protein
MQQRQVKMINVLSSKYARKAINMMLRFDR